MIPTTTRRATIEDIDRLEPETRAQLIGGDIVFEPAPTYRHQRIVVRLVMSIGDYARRHGGEVLCAPVDVELGPHDLFQPDVIYISDERTSIITEKRIVGAPDLVIEILSPSSGYHDLRTKKIVYERTGVSEYWVVDPMLETIEVFVNGSEGFDGGVQITGEAAVASRILPHLDMTARKLFA
jgi:Uma2 family endonuclease